MAGEGTFPKESGNYLYSKDVNIMYGQSQMYVPLIQQIIRDYADHATYTNAWKDSFTDNTTQVESHTGLTYEANRNFYYLEGVGTGTYIGNYKVINNQTIKSGAMWAADVMNTQSRYDCDDVSIPAGTWTTVSTRGSATASGTYFQLDTPGDGSGYIKLTADSGHDYKTETEDFWLELDYRIYDDPAMGSGWSGGFGFTDGTADADNEATFVGGGYTSDMAAFARAYIYVNISEEKAYINSPNETTPIDLSGLSNWYLFGKNNLTTGSPSGAHGFLQFKLIYDSTQEADFGDRITYHISSDDGANWTAVTKGLRAIIETAQSNLIKLKFIVTGVQLSGKDVRTTVYGGLGGIFFDF